MSVDFEATVSTPFSVAALVAAARATVAELVGLPVVPAPRVFLGRVRVSGRVTNAGREPRPGELNTLMLGGGPGSRLPEIDIVDPAGDDLVVPFESWSGSGGSRVIFSPRRDREGIVWGLGFAIAAARLGSGRLVDDDLRLTDPPITDPDAFVAATRRPPHPGPFADAIREFLAQFDAVRGWLVP
jgi:hypothetical protein